MSEPRSYPDAPEPSGSRCPACRALLVDGACPDCTLTGGLVYLSNECYDSPFADRTRPETLGDVLAPVGRSRGTYYKTTKVKDDMTVWVWGGVHPDDLKSGVRAS